MEGAREAASPAAAAGPLPSAAGLDGASQLMSNLRELNLMRTQGSLTEQEHTQFKNQLLQMLSLGREQPGGGGGAAPATGSPPADLGRGGASSAQRSPDQLRGGGGAPPAQSGDTAPVRSGSGDMVSVRCHAAHMDLPESETASVRCRDMASVRGHAAYIDLPGSEAATLRSGYGASPRRHASDPPQREPLYSPRSALAGSAPPPQGAQGGGAQPPPGVQVLAQATGATVQRATVRGPMTKPQRTTQVYQAECVVFLPDGKEKLLKGGFHPREDGALEKLWKHHVTKLLEGLVR
eukprot:TRINITY_DN9518_c0_g2_i3.p1 TRINITY_DN9518_c0_g2~~TRINITY_DN9518_c0_g2_i3.p1  ORF type:complete len:294 (+),score=27.62 TRINITY_DN9518_c0_g2_i3:83-964(+)